MGPKMATTTSGKAKIPPPPAPSAGKTASTIKKEKIAAMPSSKMTTRRSSSLPAATAAPAQPDPFKAALAGLAKGRKTAPVTQEVAASCAGEGGVGLGISIEEEEGETQDAEVSGRSDGGSEPATLPDTDGALDDLLDGGSGTATQLEDVVNNLQRELDDLGQGEALKKHAREDTGSPSPSAAPLPKKAKAAPSSELPKKPGIDKIRTDLASLNLAFHALAPRFSSLEKDAQTTATTLEYLTAGLAQLEKEIKAGSTTGDTVTLESFRGFKKQVTTVLTRLTSESASVGCESSSGWAEDLRRS